MDSKILLQDLAQGVSNRVSLSKTDADNFVRNVFEVIEQYLREDKIVKIKGFGTFKVVEVNGRDSVNVNTGERIHIGGHSKVSFTPDTVLRDQVNRPFADFDTVVLSDGVDLAEMERLPETSGEGQVEEPQAEEEAVMQVLSPEYVAPIVDKQEIPASEAETLEEEVSQETKDLTNENLESRDGEVHSTGASQVSVDQEEQVSPEVSVAPEDLGVAVPRIITDESERESGAEQQSEQEIEPEKEIEPERKSEPEQEIEPEQKSEPEQETEPDLKSESEQESEQEQKQTVEASTKETMAEQRNAEKVIYIERKPCKCCKICYFLLLLALMALSYLAGSQNWFGCSKNTDAECSAKTENVVKQDAVSDTEKKETVVAAVDDEAKTAVNPEEDGQDNADEIKTTEATSHPSVQPSAPQSTNDQQFKTQPSSAQSSTTPSTVVHPASQSANAAATQSSQNSAKITYEIVGTKCTHTVKAGEGLYRLARMYYNDMNMAEYIVRYNNIAKPDLVPEGAVLKIPELRKVE